MNSTVDRKTILVVDDEPEVRDSTALLLEAIGFDVLQAADAKSALAALDRSSVVDLLFTDLSLPGGVNGAELAKKALEGFPDLKVILTTGRPEMAAGLDYPLIGKPFRMAELGQAIDQVLQRGDRGLAKSSEI